MVGAPLDLSLTSRWPQLEHLSLHGGDCTIARAVLTSSGAEVNVRTRNPADTHRQLQGLVDGFIRPRWGRWLQHASLRQLVPPVCSMLSIFSPANAIAAVAIGRH